jgi:ABC-2 type transport system ATP-binding protein
MALIAIEKLVKRFDGGGGRGAIVAVDGVSFSVHAGEVVGFLGPNGAGKSTTMKMVTGFLTPTSGSAKVAGFDVQEKTLEAQRAMGYLPEGAPAYPDMTPDGFLKFVARARGMSGPAQDVAIKKAVERTQLQGVLHQPIETLSKGFKRRVGLAQAILHEPRVLIMDEPTDGLDPNQKHEVRNLIKTLARGAGGGAGTAATTDAAGQQGRAIVLSTHILEEVEAVCTRAIVIAKGKIVADCTPAELLAKSRHHHAVTITVRAPAGSRVRDELLSMSGVRAVEVAADQTGRDGVASSYTVTPKESAGDATLAARVLGLCQSRGWGVDGLRTEQGRLDDVFRDLTAAKE